MTIHGNDHFESFLASVRVEPQPTDSPYELLTNHPQYLYLVYPEIPLKLESVLKVIRNELSAVGCFENREIALATLALIAETRPDNSSSVEHANQMIKRAITAKLHSAIVTARSVSTSYFVRIGAYELKPFDPSKLLYWGNRKNSKWPEDLNRFRGRLAVQRDPYDLKIFNWNEEKLLTTMRRKWSIKEILECLVDAYYQAIFSQFILNVRTEISDQMLVLEAASMVSDHSDIVEEFLSNTFGLFVMDTKEGWAVMSRKDQLHFNTTPASAYSNCREWLVRELGFIDFEVGKLLDETASRYCGFLRRAQRHRLLGGFDEAFLHFVVALDLLFGQRSGLADSVAGRTATVTHKALGHEWRDQRKRVQKLYDARSRYVHEGASPSEQDLREAEDICLEVLWALLKTCAQNQILNADEWLKGIDYVQAAMQADKPIASDEFTRLGIAFDQIIRRPPNRVLDDLERSGNLPSC